MILLVLITHKRVRKYLEKTLVPNLAIVILISQTAKGQHLFNFKISEFTVFEQRKQFQPFVYIENVL